MSRVREMAGDAVVWLLGALATAALVVVACEVGLGLKYVLVAIAGSFAFVLIYVRPSTAIPFSIWALFFVSVFRRVLGGADGYTPNDPLILVPTVVLLPLILRRLGSSRKLRTSAKFQVVLTLVALITTVLGLMQGAQATTVALGFVQFVIPMLAVLVLGPQELTLSFRRAIGHIRTAGVLAAAYGYVQYFAPPRWDLSWLSSRASVVSSFGVAAKGEFRLFGTSSSPLGYATLLALVICCWLLVRGKAPWWVSGLVVAFVAVPLLLTSVRTSVFALLMAIMIYALFRKGPLALLVLAPIPVVYAALPLVLGRIDPRLSARFSLTGLHSDTSLEARVHLLSSELLRAVFSLGLGPGGSTDQSTVVDNGYLAAFLDLGLLGGVTFLVAIGWALIKALGAATGRIEDTAYSVAIVLVVLLVVAEASAPTIQGDVGLLFWLSAAFLESRREIARNPTQVISSQLGVVT
ncbi:hypothetical protein [Curtobacterium sp. MCBD17_003]|uniref:hypothetical protein n=1 Tax=Curtobacterium sp. MCBD17_003 TaxID=2175667 RepID=UPI000DA8B236|nr:hypothetical protein [Curtobacterium sp. MCBD17_003]WIE55170.1 hypothetical protein DEI88_002875 [Curtobacterium sp. MCBD17_003]